MDADTLAATRSLRTLQLHGALVAADTYNKLLQEPSLSTSRSLRSALAEYSRQLPLPPSDEQLPLPTRELSDLTDVTDVIESSEEMIEGKRRIPATWLDHLDAAIDAVEEQLYQRPALVRVLNTLLRLGVLLHLIRRDANLRPLLQDYLARDSATFFGDV